MDELGGLLVHQRALPCQRSITVIMFIALPKASKGADYGLLSGQFGLPFQRAELGQRDRLCIFALSMLESRTAQCGCRCECECEYGPLICEPDDSNSSNGTQIQLQHIVSTGISAIEAPLQGEIDSHVPRLGTAIVQRTYGSYLTTASYFVPRNVIFGKVNHRDICYFHYRTTLQWT